jgi:hypothetical protein
MFSLLVALTVDPAFAGAKVSAFQKDTKRGANYWAGAAAIDGKSDTAWMVPGESPNRGEWIELDLPKGEIDKLAIMPGFAKDAESFGDYPRVKQLRVDIFDLDDDQVAKQVGTATINVEDKMELQYIDLPDTKIGQLGLFGGKVKISVVDIYEGRDYPNFAVSELSVVLKEFDAGSAKVASVSASNEGKDAEMLSDGDNKTVWTGKDGVEMTVSRGGYGVSSIGFFAAGKDMARPKTVEIKVGAQKLTTVLADSTTGAWASVPAFNGYNGGGFDEITVTIVDSYPGAKGTDLGLAEVKFKATSLESI